MTANSIFHAQTKYIEIDLYFVKDKVSWGEINIEYVPSEEHIAYVFTKPMSSEKFIYFKNKLKSYKNNLKFKRGCWKKWAFRS